MPRRQTFITELLRAATQGDNAPLRPRLTTQQVGRLCGLGLGPLAWHLHEQHVVDIPDDSQDLLQGADLTSRVLFARTSRAAGALLAELRRNEIDTVLLKGISVAGEYYDPPWCRIMGDVDILVDERDLEMADKVVRSLGYVADENEALDLPHHHLPAVRHPETGVIIELHAALFPPGAAPAAQSLFMAGTWKQHLIRSALEGNETWRLTPEYQFAYITAHWATDRKWPVNVLAVLDLALIAGNRESFDWPALERWLEKDTWLAGCLTVLLAFLMETALCRLPGHVRETLDSNVRRLGQRNVRFMLRLIQSVPMQGQCGRLRFLDERRGRMLWRHMLTPGPTFLARNRSIARLIATEAERSLQNVKRLLRRSATTLRASL